MSSSVQALPALVSQDARQTVLTMIQHAQAEATILVVDDLPANRALLVAILGSHGHRMIEAADGREALAMAQTEHPDLVITDVLMPVMDGYEFVKQLRLDPAISAIPVMFCTAHYGAREARTFALSSGVSHILTKPLQSQEVLRIVGRVLSAAPLTVDPPDAEAFAPAFDREHLQLLTDQVSEKAGDLRAANARLRALINIGLELASERNPDLLLQSVCAAALDLFGATYVTLGILNLTDHTVQRFASCGEGAAGWVKTGDAISGLLAKVVAERHTVRGDNPDGDPAALQLPAHHPRVQTFVAAPVASPAHVYGWFCLVGNDGQTFSEEDQHLVTALSGQIGRIYESTSFAAVASQRAADLEHEILQRAQVEAALRVEREALRTAEERMRFAMEAARVGIWDLDFATGALQWSEILESQHGLKPGTFAGKFKEFLELVHPQDREALVQSMARANRSGADFSMEYRALWPDGTERWLSGAGRIHLGDHGEPIRGIGISLDVTERRSLDAQFQQAQKMEAIGQLASGVAHDFNNLLTAILGYCELLLADRNPDDWGQRDIAQIQKAGISAAALTRQLLGLSRKHIVEPVLLDLNLLVREMRPMLDRLLPEDVRVVLGLQAAVVPIKADRGQLEQVVLNLVVNAQDAMPAGGTLTIETANVELDEHYERTHLSVKAGPYVALTVSDTGTGMTPQVQARLFEPFFTTKPVGKGTGLGLPTVHAVVARSGGSVNVTSEIGRGTSFKLYFPKADPSQVVIEAPPPATVRPPAGTQTLLVVEDAAGLRELTRRLLVRLGYTVLVAADTGEALRLFAQHPAIDLVLTDVVMPGGNGPELIARLVALRPALKAVYMSGYTEDAVAQRGVPNPGVVFLQKPFNSDALRQKLLEAFDR